MARSLGLFLFSPLFPLQFLFFHPGRPTFSCLYQFGLSVPGRAAREREREGSAANKFGVSIMAKNSSTRKQKIVPYGEDRKARTKILTVNKGGGGAILNGCL